MNAHLRKCQWAHVCTAGLFALVPSLASGQQVNMVSKAQAFTQTDSSGPVISDKEDPFAFSVRATGNATLTLPAGGTRALSYSAQDQSYSIEEPFLTKAALDAAWPGGTYRLSGAGLPTLAFNLTTDNYPTGTPQVIGGTWNNGMLVVDPGQTVTISLNTFTGFATSGLGGHSTGDVYSVMGTDNVRISNIAVSQAMFGLPASSAPITSITIPAGRLTSGRVYEGYAEWGTATSIDTANSALATFIKSVNFYIAAQTPGTSTPLPVITAQPTNQTGALGGSVSFPFSFNFNVTGNIMVNWYFNGHRIVFDGVKYSNTNGLTVRNLTAADAGTYVVRLGNAGGFVKSTPATLTIATSQAAAITRQPTAQTTVSTGSTAVLSVAATGVPAPNYQWRLNGANLPGATGATLVIQNAGAGQQGTYTVVVGNPSGPNVISEGAALTVVSGGNNPGRLINLSILTPLGVGETMTMGTVLGGSGTSGNKPLLARAVGPSLAQFGITAFLPSPALTLNYTTPSPAVVVATNAGWGGEAALSSAFSAVGAFPFANSGSKDSAIFRPGLAPGNYTVQVSDAGNGSGTLIAELYDETPAASFSSTTPRLINVSVLKTIGAGASLTAGFVIGGATGKTVLIRAVGPTLGVAPFNIGNAMPDPQLTLSSTSVSPAVVVASNNDWSGDPAIMLTASRVGAFAVGNGSSKDAMLLLTLAPGNYTAQVSPVGGTAGGTAIVEVYEVP